MVIKFSIEVIEEYDPSRMCGATVYTERLISQALLEYNLKVKSITFEAWLDS